MMNTDWLDELDPKKRDEAKRLLKTMMTVGVADPEIWAGSEVREDIPQLARFLVLKRLWEHSIDRYTASTDWIQGEIMQAERKPTATFSDAGMALKRLVDMGVDVVDIGRIARMVAYEAIFDVLHTIDEGADWQAEEEMPELKGQLPGWRLIEISPQDQPTNRIVGGLHESILMLDPSGRDGSPESLR